MNYKNKDNEKAYNERGEYNSQDYHGKNENYKATKHNTRANAENGTIKDEYTGAVKRYFPDISGFPPSVLSFKNIFSSSWHIIMLLS